MILFIDTTKRNLVHLALSENQNMLEKRVYLQEMEFAADYDQAEKLLPKIEKICGQADIGVNDLHKIIVNNENGSFSALRIGVVTANALGYALRIPVESPNRRGSPAIKSKLHIVRPRYGREPNITVKNPVYN